MSCVKISNTPKAVIAIKSVIPDIGVIHNRGGGGGGQDPFL